MHATIARARREDAFACAALRLRMDLEAGEANRPGFVTEYADYLLAYFAELPIWVAKSPDGTVLGMVQTSLIRRPPSLARSACSALYVAVVFVVPDARGHGLAERMLRVVGSWADAEGVTRMMLNAAPRARSLYERAGFAPPSESHLHRDAPFTRSMSGSGA